VIGSNRTFITATVTVIALLVGFLGGWLAHRPPADTAFRPTTVDVGFNQEMILHHRQAVEMAALVVAHGADPKVKELGMDMLKTQQDQIGRMSGWLESWGKSLIATPPFMAWMGMPMPPTSGPDGRQMPGMASDNEMAKLRSATGKDADLLFLQLMLRHHQGGADMMEYGAAHASFAPERALAASMVTTQAGEMTLLTQMITARGGQPLAMN
jgi:uncharacterized protein (DUF305 family)